jgi:hypothetical protein
MLGLSIVKMVDININLWMKTVYLLLIHPFKNVYRRMVDCRLFICGLYYSNSG